MVDLQQNLIVIIILNVQLLVLFHYYFLKYLDFINLIVLIDWLKTRFCKTLLIILIIYNKI